MARILYLKACLLIFLIILVPGALGQVEIIPHVPSLGIAWEHTRPNFYDTKLTDAQREMLAPLPEDETAFAAFLKQENTGIFRLHPKGKYEPGRTVSVEQTATEMILPILGGGAYYSFTERTNKLGPWSDIRFEENRLAAGLSNQAIGILTSLGDVPLASVSLTTPGLDFLSKLTPPKKSFDIAGLIARSSRGFEENAFIYNSIVEASPNTTYALRSILYKKNGAIVHAKEPYHRLKQSIIGYGGSDVLVAFRVIRRHEDGSVTILWKKLQQFRALKMKGSTNEVKQLIAREIVKGMSHKQVIAFLEAQAIEHTASVEAPKDEKIASGAKEFVYATIPNIERIIEAVFDLHMQFAFNEKRELIDWKIKKHRAARVHIF
jgi:hypothetical protein